MSEFEPNLAALTHADRFIDALAARDPVEFTDADDDALAALLADWRDELRWPPASALVSEPEAAAALQRGLAEHPRVRRAPALIGAAAAAFMVLGGFGAMVGCAQPGDAFYGVRTVLLGEPPSVHDDSVALTAKTELEQVQQMINQGQWGQAQDKLAAVNERVQTVNDTGRKQGLVDQVNQLNAKVANRDPNASVAQSSSSNPVVPSSISTTTLSASESSSAASTTTTTSSISPPATPTSAPSTTPASAGTAPSSTTSLSPTPEAPSATRPS